MQASSSYTLRGASALVTGGAGFIGSHLVDALVDLGAERIHVVDDLSLGRLENLANALDAGVRFTEVDCCSLDALRNALDGEIFDYCFNLAVIPLPASLVEPRRNVDRNIAMTSAVCELARMGFCGRLVQYSSSEVYGTAQSVPMSESHPIHPHTPYAAAKAATDFVASSFAQTFGIDIVTVRPFNTYGERQNNGAYAGLIPAVINAVRMGEPVQIFGDGEQTRDMTYVGDTVRATVAAATVKSAPPSALNVGSGTEISVNEMVRTLLAALGRDDHPVRHVDPRPGEVRRLLADIRLAETLLGYEPQVSLREGFERTVSWYSAISSI